MDEQRNTKRVIIHFSTVTPAFLFSYVPVLLITRHLAGNKNSILHLYVRKSKNTDKGKKKTKLTRYVSLLAINYSQSHLLSGTVVFKGAEKLQGDLR